MILIVDDHPDVVRALARLMGKHGYRCATALSGPEALAAIELGRTRLVVLDWMMPGMDGARVLRTIGPWAWHRGVPVVVYTADRVERMATEALALGASAVVSKAAAVDHLLAEVRRLLPPPPVAGHAAR